MMRSNPGVAQPTFLCQVQNATLNRQSMGTALSVTPLRFRTGIVTGFNPFSGRAPRKRELPKRKAAVTACQCSPQA